MTIEERLEIIEKKLDELCEIMCFKYKENEKFLSKEKVTQKETHNSKDKEIIYISNDLKDLELKDLIYTIIDYTNKKLDTNYRYTNKKIKTLVNSRVSEGFKFDDFKYVIDVKYNEWHDTDMAKYLRYDTLFGNKFEIYRNQKPTKITKKKKEELEMEELRKISQQTSNKIRGII